MDIGVGSYALFWEWRGCNPRPLPIARMVDRAAELGCEVFQICDDARIADHDADDLRSLQERAGRHGVRLELGTRSIDPGHLETYLRIAEMLDARLLRSMVERHEAKQAADTLGRVLPRLESSGIDLALETYEQVPTAALVATVEQLESERVGICLDPGNCVAALEHPDTVIETAAPYVLNVHAKDFRFDRQDGWVGFTFSGARMGEGMLDLDHLLTASARNGRRHSVIVEHWLPWQGDPDTTVAMERSWTDATLEALRARRSIPGGPLNP